MYVLFHWPHETTNMEFRIIWNNNITPFVFWWRIFCWIDNIYAKSQRYILRWEAIFLIFLGGTLVFSWIWSELVIRCKYECDVSRHKYDRDHFSLHNGWIQNWYLLPLSRCFYFILWNFDSQNNKQTDRSDNDKIRIAINRSIAMVTSGAIA